MSSRRPISPFFLARLVVYAVTFTLLLIMVFADPFSDRYLCNEPGITCPGCGLKTALWLLLNGNFEEALSENLLVIPTAIAAALAAIDIGAHAASLIKAKEKG